MKRPIVLLPLVLFLLLAPNKISKGCGPYDYGFYGYSFLNPRILNLEAKYLSYFAGFEEVFKQLQSNIDVQEKDNITEWQERFCDIAKKEDIKQVVYKAPIRQLQVFRTIMSKKKTTLPAFFATNTFAAQLKDSGCLEAVDYLIYAKKCEPHVVNTKGWTTPPRDTIRMNFLIKDGLRAFKRGKSDYFKLRYAYQIIRLAHYKKNYAETLELYDYLIPKIDHDPSLIEYWIEGHRAGALMGLGRNVEAAYEYAKIFQHCPSKRTSAFRSFKINTNEEWQACLRLCQDDQERATLYALRASDPKSNVAAEMEEIYLLDKHNENLELLLVREIRKLEKDLLGLEFNKKKAANKRNHNIPREEAGQRVLDLQNLVRGIVREGQIKNMDLWRIAEGYLELLAGDNYAAKKTLQRVQETIEDETLKEQIQALLMVASLHGFESVDEDAEKLVAEYRKSPIYKKYPDFEKFTNDKLRYVYKKQGLIGKSYLFDHQLKDLKYNPEIEVIEDLVRLCRKENRNKLEDELVVKANGSTIESDLWDIEGTYYLSQYQLEKALETFRKIPRAERDNYAHANPFREIINDCINCRIVDTASYNTIEILEKIVELDFQAKVEEEKSAAHYYNIGIALYNISYFGHAWKVADFFRSGASWDRLKTGNDVFPTTNSESGNLETVDCTIPLYYFDKSYQLARSDELAARAAFMAAKCEQNLFYTTKGSQYSTYDNHIPNVPDDYRRYFNVLISDLQETQFFEEVIAECLYLERYAERY